MNLMIFLKSVLNILHFRLLCQMLRTDPFISLKKLPQKVDTDDSNNNLTFSIYSVYLQSYIKLSNRDI